MRLMKHVAALCLFLTAGLLYTVLYPVRAEAPECVSFEIVATPKPEPVVMDVPVPALEWSEAEVDGLASIFWASCNSEREKRAYATVVWNRAHHGDPFPRDLVGVIHQKGEFQRGRVSDRNRALARDCLDRCAAGACNIPASAVYIAREGGVLRLYDINWKLVLTIKL